MAGFNIRLTGWTAAVIAVALAAFVGVRFMTFNDKTDDDALMRAVELQLMTDFLPGDVERLKEAYETGDADELEEAAGTVTSTDLDIESIRASYPPFDFSTPKDVVVKAEYSLKDASGLREEGTRYYLFEHGSLGDVWDYKYDSNVVSYYLNFM